MGNKWSRGENDLNKSEEETKLKHSNVPFNADFSENKSIKCELIDLIDRNESNRANNCEITVEDNLIKSSSNLSLSKEHEDDDHSNFSLVQENMLYSIESSSDGESFSSDFEKQQIESKLKIYEPNKLKLLNDDQNIEEIRNRKKLFTDEKFEPCVRSLIKDVMSDFAGDLFSAFKCHRSHLFLNELNEKIKWKRCQFIAYSNKNLLELKNEFVLNEVGTPLSHNFKLEEYLNYFSIYDIFQGILGDCFLIGTIMGITRNKQLLGFVVPADNALRANMKFGAYHFRLWKLGEWYDCVIDDYLPVNGQYETFFTRNLTFPNEFWIPLLEKAIAKFVGSYDILHGGLMANAALMLSGGIHDCYYTDACKFITDKSHFKSLIAYHFFRRFNEQYDVNEYIPTIDELFEILKYGNENFHILGCFTLCEKKELNYGVMCKHQYHIANVYHVNNRKIIKIQNPHNTVDKIKKKLEYAKFEKYVYSLGIEADTHPGEFFMSYKDFVECFEGITVFNLLPENPIKTKKNYDNLTKKSSLFTQWKIIQFNGKLVYSSNLKNHLKILIQVEKKNENILASCVQAYYQTAPLVKLNLYKIGNSGKLKFFKSYEPVERGYVQSVIRLCLEPGKYVCHFELLSASSFNSTSPYCARIFYDRNSEEFVSLISKSINLLR